MVGKGTYQKKEEKARIVMEVLSNTSTIAEICGKYNVEASAVYKWRDAFIAGGRAAMEHGRSTVEASLSKEINELKGIIGELTMANETLKKNSFYNEREAMNDLVSKGSPRSRSAHLTGTARSMIHYQRRKREPQYDADLEIHISDIVTERPSYGTRRVTAMIRRSGIRVGRNRIRRHMRHMNLISTRKKVHRKHVPRTVVVARPNILSGMISQRYT